ncbi:alpha/beta hydrolase [Tuwongella immobilis]|uniref:BD-FAE-like domain-containing protein n=1 Tax=Tuwongella immobilis TaxID=692036 RepID=A0A6C2YNW7_9BACT|nr:alpha/beta hydrolase [Tuwongella immobilis]VIP02823.1 alpha beta hydrolase : Alpha/beta hydrolase fold-3 domain protein OS=Pirellula staleyi (strain ATCC 27377 / DSM 6068 / ICPB 4128) GN=Psta_2974 PE=4 SV=1: Abhydrolase_3 [Tuwongella immobilis]VTS02557.1 alpha beta hydrolase : Alpha/beta hydrolase fold-3 domain protein OS=Pirellula staleyi (strain ATCC 27377 / DSM 6068 / ICPB 4128) GN=Psta_2974 PE=4 SV=1: Abhydrolase_3 [Tuwongella immobilis]
MNRTRRDFLQVAGLGLLAGSTPMSLHAAETPGIRRLNDVVYRTIRTDPKPLELAVDVAIPTTGKGPFPTLVCIHGGAWRTGSRKDLSQRVPLFSNRSFTEILAEKGFVAVSVGYRLSDVAAFPAQIEDCKTVVRFLRANAAKFSVDPEKIGAVGFSAGGHLACLLGTTTPEQGFDGSEYGQQSSHIQAVVSFFGPTDLTLYAGTLLEKTIFGPLLGGTVKERREAFLKASPISYVNKSTAPTLLIHGTADTLVPIVHSRRFHARLQELRVPTELLVMQGESHGWLDPQKIQQTLDATTRFFSEQLKP